MSSPEAKRRPTPLHAVVQRGAKRRRVAMAFDAGFSRGRYQLCRATPDLLAALEAGELSFAAGRTPTPAPPQGVGVRLAAQNRSFRACLRDTSNQLLLVAPAELEESVDSGGNFRICGVAGTVLDMEQDFADLAHLREAMREVEVCANEALAPRADAGVSFTQLCDTLALAPGEIRRGLETLGCICINGAWRGIAEGLQCTLTEAVTREVLAEDHPLDAVPLDKICAGLAGDFAPQLVRHICHTMSDEDDPAAADALALKLSFRKMARAEAKAILRRCSKGLEPAAFRRRWHDALPGATPPEDVVLEGIAVEVDVLDVGDLPVKAYTRKLVLLDAADLPVEPKKRFQALFGRKPLWTRSEIMPYLSCYGSEVEILKMLVKHAKKDYANEASVGEFQYCTR